MDMLLIPTILLLPLEKILNQYLRSDADALYQLTDYQGKKLVIEWPMLELQFVLYVQAEGITLSTDVEDEPDARITTTPTVFIRELTRKWQADMKSPPLQEYPDMTVTGNGVFAQTLWDILWRLQVDWEEQLASLIGDIPAHQLGNLWRELRAFGQTAFTTLVANTREYLQYESCELPPPHAVDEFYKAIDQLQTNVARLENRVNHLQNQFIKV